MGLCKVSNESTRAIAEVLSKKRTLLAILLIAVYAVINGILLYFHEPWRDEAQAWLIARDLTFWEIPSLMSYEGHPCLWHWILYPFAHIGLPYITINIVSFVITLAATAFMVWKAPFPIWVKALFALSPCLTYFYPVIARSYCLIPPILFALAYLYPTRKEHPCRYTIFIALLVHTHVIMEMMALMLGVLLLIEYARDTYKTRNYRKAAHYFIALLIPLASAIILLYILRDVENASAFKGVSFPGIRPFLICLLKMSAVAGVGIFLVVIAAVKRTATTYTAVLVAAVSICFQAWIYVSVYGAITQRYLTATLIIMWAFWITQDERNDEPTGISENKYVIKATRLCNIVLALFFFALIITLQSKIYHDLIEPYSNSKDAAKFIKTNIKGDAVFLMYKSFKPVAMLPYLDKEKFVFHSATEGIFFDSNDVNDGATMTYKDFKKALETHENSDVPVYLILVIEETNIPENKIAEDYELVYSPKTRSIMKEDFDIYKIH